jgi:hypothetical protein
MTRQAATDAAAHLATTDICVLRLSERPLTTSIRLAPRPAAASRDVAAGRIAKYSHDAKNPPALQV